MHAMTLVAQRPQRSNYAPPLNIGYVAKHNHALESVKRPRVLVWIDLCVQLSTLKTVALIDKERELKAPHLNRKCAQGRLKDGQPLGVLEAAEDPSHAFAEV
jgi:hypothetical protein